MSNYNVVVMDGKIKNVSLLKKNKWLMFLAVTTADFYNAERLEKISEKSENEVLDYVLRTLDIYTNDKTHEIQNMPRIEKIRHYIEETLKWSEVAKCGSKYYREEWLRKGYNLAIHNEASADIYREYSTDNEIDTEIIYRLIYTHGMIGQAIRGEVSLTENYMLTDMILDGMLTAEELKLILQVLNKCVICAVSELLYFSLQKEIDTIINKIVLGQYEKSDDDTVKRMRQLLPRVYTKTKQITHEETTLYDRVFNNYKLWYMDAAIGNFSAKEISTILNTILKTPGIENVENISFKPILDSMFYDYEGVKKENVYKKRIIEFHLSTMSSEHVQIDVEIANNSAIVDFLFTPACKKLIEFCMEAEKEHIVSYSESITMLFDQFGFRKSKLDRLNNESSYLNTMNDAKKTTKSEIPYHVVGNRIVDVGSGGGILLDSLEKMFPEKTIIGTDISPVVVDRLVKRKNEEGHSWEIKVHNFVDGPLKEKVSTIIFSSIIHEIYSFTNMHGKTFQLESVNTALHNAYNSLEPGGRIIIRDGVKADSDEIVTLIPETEDMYHYFKRFYKLFKGLSEIDRTQIQINESHIKAPINYIREFLFTYTWGPESFPYEVLEQFGYMTLQQYKDFIINDLGGKIVKAEEFLEPGYIEHLQDKFVLKNSKGEKISLPNSNLFLVIEKKGN